MTSAPRHIRSYFFLALLIGVSIVAVMMFFPFLITLAIATAFAVVLQPLYKALLKIMKGRASIASILTILITALLILGPLMLIGIQIVQEATALYEHISENQDSIPENFFGMIEDYVHLYVPGIEIDLQSYVGQGTSWVAQHLGSFFAGTLGTLLQIFIGVIAFYYLLKDGKKFVIALIGLSPLADLHDESIFRRLELAVNSIIKGSLLIALIQGITSGIGFAIFGVPSATLWGLLAAVGALIPGVGTAIVIGPAVLYLFLMGQTGSAIGLAIWGTIAVGMIDNFLGPVLVGRGVRIHPLFILLSVLGGIQFFGPLGFILGPLVLSLLFALLDIYKMLYLNTEKQ